MGEMTGGADIDIEIRAIELVMLLTGLAAIVSASVASMRKEPPDTVFGLWRPAALVTGIALLVIPISGIVDDFVAEIVADLIMAAGFAILIWGIVLDRRFRKKRDARQE